MAPALTQALLLAVAVGAEDWPQWRGLKRDGVCDETGLLQSFPAEGLKVRWRVPVGWGFSSPVVAQGRVFLADSELMKPTAKERLHCLDETTGKSIWTHSYDVAYEDWAFDQPGDRSVSTPIVQSGQVYSMGRLGHLFCLDARNGKCSGRGTWRRLPVGFAQARPVDR